MKETKNIKDEWKHYIGMDLYFECESKFPFNKQSLQKQWWSHRLINLEIAEIVFTLDTFIYRQLTKQINTLELLLHTYQIYIFLRTNKKMCFSLTRCAVSRQLSALCGSAPEHRNLYFLWQQQDIRTFADKYIKHRAKYSYC